MSKVALIGSAPSSVRLGPYADPSWRIWACSPGAYGIIGQQRMFQEGDAFFELHRWEAPVIGDASHQVPWFSPEYCQFLREFKGVVYTGEVIPEIRGSIRLPRETLIEKHGPYFFTSSLAWMLAMALEDPNLEEVGMWGVDMAATEEYAQQRPGCQYFLQLALRRGIRVTIPPESDLLQPMPLYGVSEWDPMVIKATVRARELQGRINDATARLQGAQQEITFLHGAMDNHKYWLNTWAGTANLMFMEKPLADVIPIKAAGD